MVKRQEENRFGVPKHAQVSQKYVQWTATTTTVAAATVIATGEHDSTIDDVNPNGPVVHDVAGDDGRASTDANDAAAAHDGAATSDYGADGEYSIHGAAATATGRHIAYVCSSWASKCRSMLDLVLDHRWGRTFGGWGRTDG